jgi:hypothetical protein
MLKLKDCEIQIICHPEEISVRGNAVVSGDNELDKLQEDKIIESFNSGNIWAWCTVELVVIWSFDGGSLQASDYLGCCSYDSESDFIDGGYYEDMCSNALAELNIQIENIQDAIEQL